MSDEIVGDGVEQVQPEAPVKPSASLRIAIGDVDAPRFDLHLVDDAFPEGYWVEAKEPKRERDVRRGVNPVTIEEAPVNRAQRRHGGGSEGAKGSTEPDYDRYFTNKCREQITDFCLPGVDAKTNEEMDLRFDRRDSTANDALYERWAKPRNRRFRNLLEDYLDWVAGRDIEGLDEEFAVLGNA